MAVQIGVPIIGLLENMSYLICPDCEKRIEVYGPSRAEETARQAGLPMLGNLPLDPKLAVMCDEGNVEQYQLDAFEKVVDKILEADAVKTSDKVGAEAQTSTFAV
jgi:hypothetical protein